MNYILSDYNSEAFYPLTLTRPISALRLGILTNREKWEKYLEAGKLGYLCEEHLQAKFPNKLQSDNILIDSRLVASAAIASQVSKLLNNQGLTWKGECLVIRIDAGELQHKSYPLTPGMLISDKTKLMELSEEPTLVSRITDLFSLCHKFIQEDFKLLTAGKKSEKLNKTNTVLGEQLFVKGDVKANCVIINTETGPVYIDKGAEIMEGTMIRGPVYIGKGAVIKMGAKIYGACSFGPECRVGGEVSNSVMQGYSNKGHDGFLGNSVLGEWCNLGADTNTSNLKNNYSEVKIWSYAKMALDNSGLQFCGLLMGDHSKAAINTQFNTGTTVGVMSNVFASGFPEKYIASFAWLGDSANERFDLPKALKLARDVMSRRHVELTAEDISMLTSISERGI